MLLECNFPMLLIFNREGIHFFEPEFHLIVVVISETLITNNLCKNIRRNPIVDCERNGEKIEINRIENEMKVQLENGNKSPFTNWKYNSN